MRVTTPTLHATLVRSIQCYWFVISYADLKFILIECSPFSRLNSTRNTRNLTNIESDNSLVIRFARAFFLHFHKFSQTPVIVPILSQTVFVSF